MLGLCRRGASTVLSREFVGPVTRLIETPDIHPYFAWHQSRGVADAVRQSDDEEGGFPTGPTLEERPFLPSSRCVFDSGLETFFHWQMCDFS
jgi:hypothetical protein